MSRRIRFTAGLVVVVAAVFVPASQAMTVISDNSPSQNGLGQSLVYVHSPGLNEPGSVPAVTFSPAIAAFEASEHPLASSAVSFTSENAASQNRVALLNAAESGSLVSGSSSFDWGDAGIGAGSLAGVLLLVGAATLAVVRRGGGRRLAL